MNSMKSKRLPMVTESRFAGSWWIALLLVAGAIGFALIAEPPLALSAEQVTLAGHDVAIYNLAGQATIEAGSGSAVVVEIVRGGRDAARLQVQSGEIGGRQTLRVIYPEKRVIYPWLHMGSSTNISVRPDGTFGGHSDFGLRRVTIASGGGGLDAHADLVVRVPAGHAVELHLAVGPTRAEKVEADLALYTANGPVECRDVEGQLKVDTGSGRVEVHGAHGDLVSIDTGSGGVVTEDIEAGTLHVDTGSGDVAVNHARARKLEIDTGSGGVMAEGIGSEQIHIDTGSGRVSLGLEQNPQKIEIDTGSGGVLVRVPSDFAASFDLDSGNGGIEVEPVHTVTYRDHGTLRGAIGKGGGDLKVDTGSGSIALSVSHGGH